MLSNRELTVTKFFIRFLLEKQQTSLHAALAATKSKYHIVSDVVRDEELAVLCDKLEISLTDLTILRSAKNGGIGE